MASSERVKLSVLLVLVEGYLLCCAQVVQADFVWGEAVKVPNVNSDSGEGSPDISADGLELYFSSLRPGGADLSYADIWKATRATREDVWNEPVNLGPPVNTPGPELNPSISADGLELYFSEGFPSQCPQCTLRPGGYGGGDLWVSKRESRGDDWGVPVNLGPSINTPGWEDYPNISADGLSLYFCSNRPGGQGNSDIYVAQRATQNDPWEPATNVGPPVSTSEWQMTTEISADGLALFICTGQWHSDVRMAVRATVTSPWEAPIPVGAANTSIDEYGLSLSSDGSTLYFGRGEIVYGGPSPAFGTYDLWQVEIIPIVDFDGDGVLSLTDMVMLIDNWGTSNPLYDIGPMPWGDGRVDIQDLKVFIAYWEKEGAANLGESL